MDWDAEGLTAGLPDEPSRRARRQLLDELHADGVSLADLRRAVAEHRLVLLPVDRLLESERRYTAQEVAGRSGVSEELAVRARQALGLPVDDPNSCSRSERDLQAAAQFGQFLEAGIPEGELLEVTRVLGRGMRRYAEALHQVVGEVFMRPGDDELQLAHRYEDAVRTILPSSAALVQYVLDAYLQELLQGDVLQIEAIRAGRTQAGQQVGVAFADLVGFTSLGEQLSGERLVVVSSRLSELTERVLDPAVRLVKVIGDAVMLVAPDVPRLLETVIGLEQAVDGDDELPPLRVGVAHGPAIARWGDWFGPAVNVASRVTARAEPRTVLCTASVRERGNGFVGWEDAGVHHLRGVSQPVQLWRAPVLHCAP